MVYTKHFTIRTMKHLRNSKDYIENATKTILNPNSNSTSHLDNVFPYIMNDDKTFSKQLVSGHRIVDVYNAANEFIWTKQMYAKRNGRLFEFDPIRKEMVFKIQNLEKGTGGKGVVLGHHLIQSFSPEDDLTPEQIHEIGRETALEFTGGEYEFVIATHVDKAHIHNHIIINSTNAVTGKAMKWKLPIMKNGKEKDLTKFEFEKVSDKIASKYGAKIIEKSPKNSHKKYTMWQTESIFKSKIKSRLDFLIDHSSSMEDFLEKANALHLSVDFSRKWATYRLLDEPQVKNTRGRNLVKSDPERYNLDRIKERIEGNKGEFSVEEVVASYEEKVSRKEDDFDFQIVIDAWQISHSTDKGYYLNVDLGLKNHGKIFIGGYKVDRLDDGRFNLFIKKNDYFYFMDDKKFTSNRYMSGASLVKQLKLYHGSVPLKKEPAMSKLTELVYAINFLAEHEVTDGRQLEQLESKLRETWKEAKESLKNLENKHEILHKVSKILIGSESINDMEELQTQLDLVIPGARMHDLSYEEIKEEIESIDLSYQLLKEKMEQTIDQVEQIHEIQVFAEERKEQTLKNNLQM